MNIPSPCISVCRMSVALAKRCGDAQAASSQGICEGCFRSIDEIVTWGTMPDSQRAHVWQQLSQRATAAGCVPPALPQALT
jgi:predicted Fe-S protein YdhL (DUF1289 family)